MAKQKIDNEEDKIPEYLAAAIFSQAVKEQRASELMESLWAGKAATVDLITGRLIIVNIK